jgi:hypothetical protein
MKQIITFICGGTIAAAFVASVLIAQTTNNPNTNPTGRDSGTQGSNPDMLERPNAPNALKPGIVPAISPSERALPSSAPGMTAAPRITPEASMTPFASPTASPMGTPSV